MKKKIEKVFIKIPPKKIYFRNDDKIPVIRMSWEGPNNTYTKFSLRMDKAEWVNDLPGEEIPTALGLDVFIDDLEEIKEDYFNSTCYDFYKHLWNLSRLNEKDRISYKKKMPNYRKLLKTCKNYNKKELARLNEGI